MSRPDFMAAYGDDPVLVDPRGHAWREVHREQHMWTDDVESWQQCARAGCEAVRAVAMHQGPPATKKLNGIFGAHEWVSAMNEHPGTAPCRGAGAP